MKGLYPTTKQFPGTVSLKLLVKKNILSLKFAHERRNLLAIAARFRFSYHVGVAIRINRPPESQVPTAAQLHRQKNKQTGAIASTITMSTTGKRQRALLVK